MLERLLHLGLLAALLSSCSSEAWITPDQRGRLAFEREDYAAAAAAFQDPMWRGIALMRDAQFKQAAAAFGRAGSAEAAFNRGNALVFGGQYEPAMDAYDRALALRPGWREAEENREIARVRAARLERPEDDYGGTDGKLSANEIVFDDAAKNSSSTQTDAGADESARDEETRALWLRRVETRPADFLRAKFAFQLLERDQAAAEGAKR